MYIDILILLIPTSLVLAHFCSSIPTSLLIKKNVFHSFYVIFVQHSKHCSKNIRDCSKIEIIRTLQYKIFILTKTCARQLNPETSMCEVPSDVSKSYS